jgi:hypothetical protein
LKEEIIAAWWNIKDNKDSYDIIKF